MPNENPFFENHELGQAANNFLTVAWEHKTKAAVRDFCDAVDAFLSIARNPRNSSNDVAMAQDMARIGMRWIREANGTVLH